MFKKAQRTQAKIKLAIAGPSGSGKTFSALRLARGLVGDAGKIALIDTENGSASLYSDRFDFDVMDLAPPFEDRKFIEGINAAVEAGYDAVIIDSASHFWEGILEYKDKLDRRGGNSFANWNEAGQHFKGVLNAVLQSPIHVIACLRSKTEYVVEQEAGKKSAPRKIGLAPVMRDGIEYEFTTVFDVDLSHNSTTSKDRTGLFTDQIFQITEGTGQEIAAWLGTAKSPAAQIEELWSELNYGAEELEQLYKWLKLEPVDSPQWEALTHAQATKVITLLKGKLAQKEVA